MMPTKMILWALLKIFSAILYYQNKPLTFGHQDDDQKLTARSDTSEAFNFEPVG
jgi:hypothetical protein